MQKTPAVKRVGQGLVVDLLLASINSFECTFVHIAAVLWKGMLLLWKFK